MATITDYTISEALFNKLKSHYNNFYAGKLKRPCDDDCPDGCDGDHFYELPDELPDLFIPQSDTRTKKG